MHISSNPQCNSLDTRNPSLVPAQCSFCFCSTCLQATKAGHGGLGTRLGSSHKDCYISTGISTNIHLFNSFVSVGLPYRQKLGVEASKTAEQVLFKYSSLQEGEGATKTYPSWEKAMAIVDRFPLTISRKDDCIGD